MSEIQQKCDCRRPSLDHKTALLNWDAVQCQGCRGWVTGLEMIENRWGLAASELRSEEQK